MPVRHLLWIALLASCARETAVAPKQEASWPLDGFLNFLPENASTVLRLPSAAAIEAGSPAFAALLRALGRDGADPRRFFLGTADTAGLAAERGAGLAITPDGAWVHYLPAADKAAVHRALRDRAAELVIREEQDWILLSRGAAGTKQRQGAPLPPGDMALRIRFHPLLDAFAQPGDALELGLVLGSGGLDLRGRLLCPDKSLTTAAVEAAHPSEGPLLDLLPPSLAVRVETTLPPTVFATLLTRRIAHHCGVAEGKDRVLMERILREALTGLSPEAGIAIGLEFRDGDTSFVALGRTADGPASPVLAKLRTSLRTEFGALVLDAREASPGIVGLSTWVVDAEPELGGLPEAGWGLLEGLAGGEDGGLTIACTEWEGWCVLACGWRADLLARAVRKRLAGGSARSPASMELVRARERAQAAGAGDYVFGIVIDPERLGELPEGDRAGLRAVFGATADADAPRIVAVAGLRRDGELTLEGRVLY